MNEEMNTTVPNTEEAPQPELTITDLNNLRQVVDLAVRRGAFAAAEMTSVGSVYDRLTAFLNAVTNQQTPPAQEPKQ